MPRLLRISAACMALACAAWPAGARATAAESRQAQPEIPQDTGFLNRRIVLQGVTYRFQVYLPEDWRRDDHKQWPIILALHGRGERGSEGMWQTQTGIAEAVRNHPDRWPFVIVMPQCPQTLHWTDPPMLDLAMASLDQESAEFHGDPARTYLTGLSMGGYGAWELARLHPHRWAAIVIASGGIFWSYEPARWQQASVLPAEYAQAVAHTPVWLFHGSLDPVVQPRQSELMYDAFKANGGDIRLWIYQGLGHDSWTRAYDEPELPRWLLAHHLPVAPEAMAERLVVPLHPPTIILSPAQLESFAGEYREPNGDATATIYSQGEQLFEKSTTGEVVLLEAEAADTFTRPGDLHAPKPTHLTFEHDAAGHVTGFILDDNRHQERWEKLRPGAAK
ncbi:MAG TPA: alpha/beta hydrolase-fold protein [Terracidiphilus sp.]|nr:alpha/beta hydrolase-fold protein [Terracidiphilus sp.]